MERTVKIGFCAQNENESASRITSFILNWFDVSHSLSLSRLMPELMRFALVSQIQCSARMPPREELNLEASRKRATSSALGAIVGCDVRFEAEVAVS